MRSLILLLEGLFWFSLAMIAMTYVVYPLSMWVAGRISLSSPAGKFETEEWPAVTLVIAAYNEEKVIASKIENSLALDYPANKLEIMVVSDESTDQTDDIVRSFEDRGVVLSRQEPRRGKSAGLTNAVPTAKGEILVFSDANSMYQPDAIRHLVKPFEQKAIGYVVGAQTYDLEEGSTVSRSEIFYWNIELAIKAGESAVGSVVGGDGAIFALRKELFEPLREDDLSDFVTPLRIIVKGYRGIFEARAVCSEETAPDYGGEYRRKVRIANRAFRTVLRVPQALNPFRVGFFALQLFFHKVVRWFVPYLMLLCLLSSIALTLAGFGWVYGLALALQLVGYGLAWQFSRNHQSALPLASLCYYFCLGNLAALQGTLGVVLGKHITMWTPER